MCGQLKQGGLAEDVNDAGPDDDRERLLVMSVFQAKQAVALQGRQGLSQLRGVRKLFPIRSL